MAERIDFELTGTDKTLSSTATKAFQAIEQQSATTSRRIETAHQTRAAAYLETIGPLTRGQSGARDTGQTFGPAVKSRFSQFEDEVRQVVAGRVRAFRDQSRRASLDDEVNRRLFGDAKPAAVSPELGEVHGPARKSRFDQYERDTRDAQAKIIKEMKEQGRIEQATAEARKRLFGDQQKSFRESLREMIGPNATTEGRLKLLIGAGKVAGISQVGRFLEGAASGVADATDRLKDGDSMTRSELVREAVTKIPVIGGFAGAGFEARRAIDNLWAGQGWATDANRSAQGQQFADDARRQNRVAGFDRRLAASDALTLSEREGLFPRFDPRRMIGRPDREREQRQRESAISNATLARDQAIRDATIERDRKLDQIKSDERSKVMWADPADAGVLKEAFDKQRKDAGDAYDRSVRGANQSHTETTAGVEAGGLQVEKDRKDRLLDLWRGYGIDRVAEYNRLQADLLRRQGSFGLAEEAEIKGSADRQKAERQRAFDAETKDYDQHSDEFRQAAEALRADLQGIENQKWSDIAASTQRRTREVENTEAQHQTRLKSVQAQATETRLQAAGRTVQAERLQLQESLRQQLEDIRINRDKELQAHAEDAAGINRRAQEAAVAANELFGAQNDALQNRPGVEINRGTAGSESAFAGGAIGISDMVTQQRTENEKTRKAIEDGNKRSETLAQQAVDLLAVLVKSLKTGNG